MQKEEKIVRGADLATTGQKIKSYVLEQIADKVSSDDIDNVVELTKAQYDALATKDARTMYIISDSAVDSDHVGIAKFEQTTKSTAPGGTNIWTVTLTNNQTFTLAVMNGTQGNSGYSGAAGELEVVNNVTQGGATSALSAEMGKQLEGEISQLGLKVDAIPFEHIVNVVEDGFYLIDVDGNVCAQYTEEGWSVVELADEYIALLQRYVSVTIGTVPGTAYDGGAGSELASRVSAIEAITNTGSFGAHHYLRFDVVSPSYRPSHDCTWVGEEFWSFDKPSDGGALRVYNSSFEMVVSKSTNFVETRKDSTTKELEMKSVDWNADRQALLIGNGAASYSVNDSYAYIFYDALDWKNATGTIDFTNCGEFKQLDFTELGYKCYAFWGPFPELVFVSINLFRDVYLVRLGMGTNDLEHGVYAMADSDKYNGSWEVVGQWTQTPVSTEGNAAHGGQYYNGSLYLATNNSNVCQVYKCKLNNSGTLQFDIIHLDKYDPSGVLTYRYIDGLCIKDGKLYAQPLNRTGGVANPLIISNII